MNPAAILGLLGDLYQQVSILQDENERLRSQLAERDKPAEPVEPS